jgi:uncharacterized protein
MSLSRMIAVSMLWLASSIAMAASFDCQKAVDRTEKLICSDPELSRLNKELNVTYQGAMERLGPDKEFLRKWQREWLASYNRHDGIMGCEVDTDCLKYMFSKRIALFKRIAPANSMTARWNGLYVSHREGAPFSVFILLMGLTDGRIYAVGGELSLKETDPHSGRPERFTHFSDEGQLNTDRVVFAGNGNRIEFIKQENIFVMESQDTQECTRKTTSGTGCEWLYGGRYNKQ